MRTMTLLCVLLALAAAPVRGSGLGEESPRDLIEAYRVWRLTEDLDLSEDQMPVFFSRLKRIDEREADLGKDERDALHDISRLLEDESVDDARLETALARYEEARRVRFEEVAKMRKEAVGLLSVRQRCRFVISEERFRSDVRSMIQRARQVRGGAELGGVDRAGRPQSGGRGRR